MPKQEQPFDAVSTNKTGPINPPDTEGNVLLPLFVGAETGHTQGIPTKRKAEATRNILNEIRRLELAVGETVKR